MHNSLKLSFMNIRGLQTLLIANLSLNQTLLTFLLCVRQAWMTQLILAISLLRGYLPLIRKDSSTHMYGLALYVKEGLPFTRDLSLENSTDSYLCFRLALLHSVSYFFFLYRSPSSFLRTVFDSISSNLDVFISGDFNVHHKTGLHILVELIDMVNSAIIFLFQMTLLR